MILYNKRPRVHVENIEIPTNDETLIFYKGIYEWGSNINVDEQLIDDIINDIREEINDENPIELLVTEEDILDIIMKLPNWKYLDNNGIQEYLLKYLEQLHQQIIQQISELINNSKTIPD